MYAINPVAGGANPSLGCRTLTVPATAADPFGSFEGLTVTGQDVSLQGWVVDPDAPAAPVATHVYVDNMWGGGLLAYGDRPDVDVAYPGYGAAHGLTWHGTLTTGPHTVCVYAINQGQGTTNPLLGCRTVTVP